MLFPFLAVLFVSACAIYAFLDLQLIRGLEILKKKPLIVPDGFPSITVLIAARNEERALPHVLDALLAQDYPAEKTQIIVVNDRSQDGTEEVLRNYSMLHPERVEYLNIVEIHPGMSPKKHALLKGLEQARGEWIAVSDADCRMGPGWLRLLSREFSPDVGMVLGMSAYDWAGKEISMGLGAQTLEFQSHGIVSAALIGLGLPINANANNLAYRRKAFDEAEAFRKHGHVVSGDDDFVLQEIHATGRWTIRFCLDPETLVYTSPPDSWGHFWEQRKRWASKCGMYRPGPVLFLAGIFAFYTAIPLALVAGAWNPEWFWLGMAGFFIKTLADFAVMRHGLRIFRLSSLLRHFPLTSLLHIPLILAAVVAGTQGGFVWKGQSFSRRV